MARRAVLFCFLPALVGLAFTPARAIPTDPHDVYGAKGSISYASATVDFTARLTRSLPRIAVPGHGSIIPSDPTYGALSFSGRAIPGDPTRCLTRANGRFSITWSNSPFEDYRGSSYGTMSVVSIHSALTLVATVKTGLFAGARLVGSLYPGDPTRLLRCQAAGAVTGVAIRVG